MMSLCICEISTKMKPNPMAAKKAKYGGAPRSITLRVVSAKGTMMHRSVSTRTTISAVSSTETALISGMSEYCLHTDGRTISFRRKTWKKKGQSSSGGVIMSGNVAAKRSRSFPEAILEKVGSTEDRGLKTTSNCISLASRSSVSRSTSRSEEHTSELQSPCNLVCRLLLEKKKKKYRYTL